MGPSLLLTHTGVVLFNWLEQARPDPVGDLTGDSPGAVISWGKSLWLCLSFLVCTVGGVMVPPVCDRGKALRVARHTGKDL